MKDEPLSSSASRKRAADRSVKLDDEVLDEKVVEQRQHAVQVSSV